MIRPQRPISNWVLLALLVMLLVLMLAAQATTSPSRAAIVLAGATILFWLVMFWQTCVFLVDVAACKAAQAEAQANQARYEEAERVAKMGHWVWLVKEDSVRWSDQLLVLYGVDRNLCPPTYAAFIDLLHPADRAMVQRTVAEALRSHDSISFEHRVQLPDGSIRHFLQRGSLVRDFAGNPVRLIGTAQDITSRKQAELALERMNRLHAVLSEANKAIVAESNESSLFQRVCRILTDTGRFRLAWVGRIEEASHLIPVASAGEAVGYCQELRLPFPECEPLAHGIVAAAVTSKRPQISTDILADPGMEPWWSRALTWGLASGLATPVLIDGTPIAVLVVYADEPDYFSEDVIQLMESLAADLSLALQALVEAERRRSAEAALVRLNAELEHRVRLRTRELEVANRDLEAFSYSVSHDLRAPLRSINSFSRILLENYQDRLDETGRDYFERIVRASERMGELIDDLLGLASLGLRPLQTCPVNLSRLAEVIVKELREVEPDRDVRFKAETDLHVSGDPQLLRIALENLLGNAWKFTRETPDACIRFGCDSSSGVRIFYIRDNGVGFDPLYAEKLFAPFQRLHSADQYEGNGIGLATVQRIIDKHSGRIWAESAVGGGATFFFCIDATVEHEQPSPLAE